MGIAAFILKAFIASVVVTSLATVAVVYIVYLTVKEIKKLVRKRLERKKKSKVAFGETRKILDENAKDILENEPSMTMEDLEEFCEETPYFVVDYDPDNDEVSDYTTIKADGVDERVDRLMHDNDGIVLFD